VQVAFKVVLVARVNRLSTSNTLSIQISNNEKLRMPWNHDEIFQPDFFGTVDNLPFFVAEFKTANKSPHINEWDRLKILCEMKLVLDLLLENGVSEPEVIGMLVQGIPYSYF
jgi:hypothetical protein